MPKSASCSLTPWKCAAVTVISSRKWHDAQTWMKSWSSSPNSGRPATIPRSTMSLVSHGRIGSYGPNYSACQRGRIGSCAVLPPSAATSALPSGADEPRTVSSCRRWATLPASPIIWLFAARSTLYPNSGRRLGAPQMACNVRCWQTLPLRCNKAMSRWASSRHMPRPATTHQPPRRSA